MVAGEITSDGKQPSLDLAFIRIVCLEVRKCSFKHRGCKVICGISVSSPVAEVSKNSRIIALESLFKLVRMG